MDKLNVIQDSLKELYDDFNTQIVALNKDRTNFHKEMIRLSAKYPEHVELINFIIELSDTMSTNQELFKDIVTDSLNNLIIHKQDLTKEMIDCQKKLNKKSFLSRISNIDIPKMITSLKSILTLASFLAVLIIAIIYGPDAINTIIQNFKGIK